MAASHGADRDAPSLKTLITCVCLAFACALVLLVTVILPAEYAIDPLGTGRFLGLVGLGTGEQQIAGVNEVQDEHYRIDEFSFTLAPFESLEYKYRLAEHAGLVYAWEATHELVFDLHAEPDGAEPGYAESFEQGRGVSRAGVYNAPFSGIHGWFWENRSQQDVSVTLRASGFFPAATEFRSGAEIQYRF
jgi:hypothetical protein